MVRTVEKNGLRAGEARTLSNRPIFTIETAESGLNYGRYDIGPLEPGYGVTLGNSLRRILLSSLEGVAITRIKVTDVYHEFSTLKDVREDLTEIVLNLKRVRLRRVMDMDREVVAHIWVHGDASGEKVIYAGDIAWPIEVDIINPDLPIATLTGPDAVLDMDVWIGRGTGYKPAEVQQEPTSIGEIPIDAIYTPIERVNYTVRDTRHDERSDYDLLTLEILSDGTIEPDEALAEAAQILVDHAKIVADFSVNGVESGLLIAGLVPDEAMKKPLADLGLSPRVLNALRSRGILTVGQVLEKDPQDLLSIRNFGPVSMTELQEKLMEAGILPEGSDHPFAVDLEAMSGIENDLGEVVDAITSLGNSGATETGGEDGTK